MKKKITALLLALTLLLSATALTGCGGDSGESSDGPCPCGMRPSCR